MIRVAARRVRSAGDAAEPMARVVGVGNAGAGVLDRLALDGIPKERLYLVNTDVQSLTASVAGHKLQIGWTITRGLGAGGDPELGFDSAAEAVDSFRELADGTDMVILCLGLGGGTGCGAAPVIAEAIRSNNTFVAAFVTLPFRFEGRRRMQQAIDGLSRLRKVCDAVICFENDRMSEMVTSKTGIHEAFAAADLVLSQSVRGLMDLATRPGLMRVGLDGVLKVLRGRDPRCHFGYGESQGTNRAQEALALALRSPLLEKGKVLSSARDVVVHICGGKDLMLAEVEEIMMALNRQASDSTQFLVGTHSDQRSSGKLSVSILCSVDILAPEEIEEVEEEPAPAPRVPQVAALRPERAAVPVHAGAARRDVPPAVEEEEMSEASDLSDEADEPEEAATVVAVVRQPQPSPVAAAANRRPGASSETSFAHPARQTESYGDSHHQGAHPAARAGKAEPKQEDFKFEPVSRGRFEKIEPTIVDGEDLDVPTFLRKNFRPRS